MKRLLISAFEPFGGEARNASLEALERLRAPENLEIHKIILPTVFGAAGEALLQAVREFAPETVICLGQAAGRAALTPERIAINLRDATIPDNAGRRPQDEPVVSGGPAAFFSTLPIKAMAEASMRVGVPAAISNSAGTFVCNDLMYSLLYALDREYPAVRGGFIHVPACEAPEAQPDIPCMPTEEVVRGLEAMLKIL